MRCKETAEVSK